MSPLVAPATTCRSAGLSIALSTGYAHKVRIYPQNHAGYTQHIYTFINWTTKRQCEYDSVIVTLYNSGGQQLLTATLDRKLPHGTAIIIGPGAHFGKEIVNELVDTVASVILVARTPQALEAIKDQMSGFIDVRIVIADITDETNFAETLNRSLDSSAPLRYVFYNLKQSSKGPALDIAPELFTEMLEANVTGALTVIQYVAKNVHREQEVKMVISGGGFKDKPDESRLGLSVSKGGLHTLVLALAPQLRRKGIRIKTAVIDGVVRAEGPLFPAYVAKALVNLAESPHVTVARIDNRSQASDRQLSLF